MTTADLLRRESVVAFLGFCLISILINGSAANVVFEVKHKFAGREKSSSLGLLKEHDDRRHGRFLSALDIPLGGNNRPSDTGLYYAQIGIGTPSKNYFVQVDTGSDILWVNCAGCTSCPIKSDLGLDLTLYDQKSSSTGKLVTCDDEFCTSMYDGQLSGCKPDILCNYRVLYGDGSSTAGYFVKDSLNFDQVTGNFQTASMNGTVTFGCGAKQSGELGASSVALDGIIGFGQANSSTISQLAASGKVKKMFAHCLEGTTGGGIFAIGEVVHPKVNTTPLVPNQAHYNVVMKAIEVGGDVLDLPTDTFDTGNSKGTIIDSGTTLAYLPTSVYEALVNAIMAKQPNLKLHIVEQSFQCFTYMENVDDGFPTVTFIFANSLSLTVYPHEYLFTIGNNAWCIGWQNSGVQSKDGRDMTLLGDLVLSNKLVFYDLVNQAIGWTEYNCSSSIQVKDEHSGAIYSVGAHDISSSCRPFTSNTFMLLLTPLIAMLYKVWVCA